jgi:Amt family ammonium transporter
VGAGVQAEVEDAVREELRLGGCAWSEAERMPVAAVLRRDGRIVAMNATARRAAGLGADEAIPAGLQLVGEVAGNPDENEMAAECVLMLAGGRHVNLCCVRRASEWDGMPAEMLVGVVRRAGLYEDLRGHGTFLEELLDSAPEALAIIHRKQILHVNHEFTRLFGYTMAEAMGRDLHELVVPAGYESEPDQLLREVEESERAFRETVRRTKTGELVDVSILMAPVRIRGDQVGHFVSYRDIRRQKKVEAELQHSALHDSLTGLANRVLFVDRLQLVMIRQQRRPERRFAILFLDLDRFKQVNDTLGHEGGDALLLRITERLKGCLRPHDSIARFGGDEFAVLLDEVQVAADAERVAERIQTAVREPVTLGGHEVQVSASIGIALGATEYATPEQIMRDADFAMYRAKANGKARHEVFDSGMVERAAVQKRVQAEIRTAVEQEQFEVWYQPVYRTATGELEGFEALLRWRHPERGYVPVGEFMQMAEETGLILPLGERALGMACRQMSEWMLGKAGTVEMVSVNLSPRQFAQRGLLEMVQAALQDAGLEPRRLQLEITEGAIALDAKAAEQNLQRLHGMGVRVALDNFGSGLASINNLLRLPFHLLKLDRRLTGVLPAQGTQAALIETIFGLGRSLEMRMQADGVETQAQLEALARYGCELVQGHLFSAAVDAAAADLMVRRGRWNLQLMGNARA